MGRWQEIWEGEGARRLWRVPDPQLVELAAEWREMGSIHRVLDHGCGVGRHVLHLADLGFEVHGTDHSESAIATCREWLLADGLEAEVWCGPPDRLPQPDGFFDAVVAFNSIYHGTADEVAAAMRLLHAKLRPEGRCFVTLLSRRNRMYGKGEEIGPDTFVSAGMFHQLFSHGGERGVPHHFSSEEEVHRFLEGFKIESIQHRELELPSSRGGASAGSFFKIPGAFFWRIVAARE